jgi:integrase
MLEKMREEAKRRGDDPANVKLPPWRLHDLRRTAASGMARLGVGIHVVERLLNHVSGSTTGGIVAVYQEA